MMRVRSAMTRSGARENSLEYPWSLDWIKRSPNPFPEGESEIEIRQLFEAEDFGSDFTPEMRDAEERLRVQAARNAES